MDYVIVFGYDGAFDTDLDELQVGGSNYTITTFDVSSDSMDMMDSDVFLDRFTAEAWFGFPVIMVTTGASGCSNHSFDAGFVPKCTIEISEMSTTCISDNAVTVELTVQWDTPGFGSSVIDILSNGSPIGSFQTTQESGAILYTTIPILNVGGTLNMSASFGGKLCETTSPAIASSIINCAEEYDGCQHIAGAVYIEYKADGIKDDEDIYRIGDVPIEGVVITIYDEEGAITATTMTDTLGAWDFMPGEEDGLEYVIEYTVPNGYYAGPLGADNCSNVEFAKVGECDHIFMISSPDQHCQDNPPMITSCFPNDQDTQPNDVLIAFDYNQTSYLYPSIHRPASKEVLALHSDIGGVNGLAWSKKHSLIFSAIYHKFGISSNSGRFGKIYTTTLGGVSNEWLDLNTLLGAGVSGVNADATDPSAVGFVGISEVDISDDFTKLYVFNAKSKEIYEIEIGENGESPTMASQIKIYQVPLQCGATTAVGGLAFFQGRIYFTTTCTGPDVASLAGKLYSFPFGADPSTVVFKEELTLDYSDFVMAPRKICGGLCCCPTPFTANYTEWKAIHSPQDFAPMCYDIAFDINEKGEIGVTIGTRNRGNETIDFNNNPDPTVGGYMHRGSMDASGDIFLEVNGETGHLMTGLPSTSEIFMRGQTNAKFYHGEGLEGAMMMGALAVIPGFKEVASPATDGMVGDYDSGVSFHSLSDGLRTRDNNIIQGSTASFAKGISWGDIEPMCELPPLSIGNLVWCDIDGDGIQEGGEKPIPFVVVNLYEDTNENGIIDAAESTPVAKDTTDEKGNYNFTDVDHNVNYNTAYIVSLDNPADTLEGGALYNALLSPDSMGLNRQLDSDGRINSDGFAQISFTTASWGQNDYGLDFGFQCPVYDLALKIVTDQSTPKKIGDTIQYVIHLYNQGNMQSIPLDSIVLASNVGGGLEFSNAINPGWTESGPIVTYQYTTLFDPDDKDSIDLYLIITEGADKESTFAVAEILSAYHSNGIGVEDCDSHFDTIPNFFNDFGGDFFSEDNDEINENGKCFEDEDDHDSEYPPIIDLALSITQPTGVNYNYGDTVKFTIDICNQGFLTASEIKVLEYIPNGFVYLPMNEDLMPAWSEEDEGASLIIPDSLPRDSFVSVCIYLEIDTALVNLAAAWTTYAEIVSMKDGEGMDQSDNDYDSTPDMIINNDAGGDPDDLTNDQKGGNGSGTPNDGDPLTDEDDHDPEKVEVCDLALINQLTEENADYSFGDTAKFQVVISNQGNTPSRDIKIGYLIPEGFEYLDLNDDLTRPWSSSSSSLAELTYSDDLLPGAIDTICIYLKLVSPSTEDKTLAWTTIAEIQGFADTSGLPKNEDIDSRPDSDFNNDSGGNTSSGGHGSHQR